MVSWRLRQAFDAGRPGDVSAWGAWRRAECHECSSSRPQNQQAQTQQQDLMQTYYRAYGACLEGRGYTIK